MILPWIRTLLYSAGTWELKSSITYFNTVLNILNVPTSGRVLLSRQQSDEKSSASCQYYPLIAIVHLYLPGYVFCSYSEMLFGD